LQSIGLIKDRDNQAIIDNVFNYHENENHNLSRAQIKEIKYHFDNLSVLDAIKAIPSKGRDPFLIFAAFLNQFPNIGSPASSDRQSFLFAMNGFYKTGVINIQEMIILGYLLGYYLSYSMTWNPVSNELISESELDNDLYKMRYSDLLFTELLLKAVPTITDLNCIPYFNPSAFREEFSKEIELVLIKDIPKRSVSVKEGRMEFRDHDLDLFDKWSSSDLTNKVKVMLILLLEENDDVSHDILSSTYLNIRNDVNGSIERFRKRISDSTVSMEQRELIRLYCK
jgi:hypothetical protein